MRFFGRSQSPYNQPLLADAALHPQGSAYVTELANLVATRAAPGDPPAGWINRGQYSCPIYRVAHSTPRVPMTWVAASPPKPTGGNSTGLAAAFAAGVPIPAGATPAAGTDQHMAVLDTDTFELWESWLTVHNGDGSWQFAWGSYIADVRTHPGFFQDGSKWGATASGQTILSGMVLEEDLAAGVIPHAISFAMPNFSATEVVWPASWTDGNGSGTIPMGMRFRLPSTYDPSALNLSGKPIATRTLQMLATAIRDYGMFLNDTAADVTFRIEPVVQGGSSTAYVDSGGSAEDIMAAIPWSSMQVLHPAWRPSQVDIPSDGAWWDLAA